MNKITGKVYLVGAGPGDHKLITLKGIECIRSADVVIYDHLANDRLLQEVKPDAECIYVGKKEGNHTLSQEAINQILVNKAEEGKQVVRLKGGDPFIFGRGGEEALYLQQAGVPFEVVPGVTAASAVLAYAGIPATHRGLATSVSLITGHEDPAKDSSGLDWAAIAKQPGTLVFYMGMRNLPYIVEKLLHNGRSIDTPVALIRWGTLPQQKTLVGTLATIVDKAQETGLRPPALIVIGEVVKLRDHLNWFESKPLFGKRIVVTRSRTQASELVELLEACGAEAIPFPTIRIVEPEDWRPLDAAISRIEDFSWVIFTSVNGVEYFLKRLLHSGRDIRDLKGMKICAIGPATASRLRQYLIKVDYQPEKFVTESVVMGFKQRGDISEQRILLPRAELARPLLVDELTNMGAKVTEVAAYRTLLDDSPNEDLMEEFKQGILDAVTFTSSSTVKNFVTKFGMENISELLNGVVVACIGPITRDTAKSYGIKTQVMPTDYTIPGLVKALVDHFQNRT